MTSRNLSVRYDPDDETSRVSSSRPTREFPREDANALRRAADLIDYWADQDGVPK